MKEYLRMIINNGKQEDMECLGDIMIDALYERGEWIKQVNNVEYRTRCPYCGDSKKSMNTIFTF